MDAALATVRAESGTCVSCDARLAVLCRDCVREVRQEYEARVAALEAALRTLVTTYDALFANDPRGNAVKFEEALAAAKALAPGAGGTA